MTVRPDVLCQRRQKFKSGHTAHTAHSGQRTYIRRAASGKRSDAHTRCCGEIDEDDEFLRSP